MPDKIKTSLFFYMVLSFTLGSVLLLSLIDNVVKQDAWFAIMVSFAVSIPFIIALILLTKRFPGKSLVEINSLVLGGVLGKTLSVLYFIFFFMLLILNINYLAGFYQAYVMAGTPVMQLVIFITVISAFAAKRGIAAIGHICFIVVVVSISIVFVTAALLVGKMDFSNFLPVLSQPVKPYIQVSHALVTIPFLDIVALLMVTPHLKTHEHLTRSVLGGVAAAGFLLLCIVVRNILVLGSAVSVYENTSYEAVRLIEIGGFITRVELLITVGYTITMFAKISMLFFASVSSFSQIVKVKDWSAFILPMGSVAVMTAAVIFKSSVENTEWGSQYHMFFATPFTMIFPPMVLVVAKIRKLGKRGNQTEPATQQEKHAD